MKLNSAEILRTISIELLSYSSKAEASRRWVLCFMTASPGSGPQVGQIRVWPGGVTKTHVENSSRNRIGPQNGCKREHASHDQSEQQILPGIRRDLGVMQNRYFFQAGQSDGWQAPRRSMSGGAGQRRRGLLSAHRMPDCRYRANLK